MSDSRCVEWLPRGEKAFELIAGQLSLRQVLAEIFYPERATFFTDGLVGDEFYRDLYDGYPAYMRWRLGNAIGSMSRGKSREWFDVTTFPDWLNERQRVGAWNADTTKTLRSIIYDPRAQFAAQLALSDQDYATFGYSPLKITTNTDNMGVLFATLHPKTCAPEENSERVIDVTHERPLLKARVIGQMFGEHGNLSRAMRKAIEDEPLTELKIAQCVFPLKDYEPSKRHRPPAGAEFVSLYMDCETEEVIDEQFFFSFPYVWRRWMRSVAGSPLALSPCAMLALADAHMSQEVRRSLIEAINYAADPARMISAGALEGSLDLSPGGDNFVRRNYDFRTGKPIQPIDTGAMPREAAEFANELRQYQGQAWLLNLLTLPDDRVKTAYEAEVLLDQDAREALPIFEPMEADNATMMSRVYSLGDKWRAFAAKPQELQRADVRYTFETPVSQALRRLRAQQGMQVVDAVSRFAQLEIQAGKTAAYRRVRWQKVQTDTIRGIGPQDWLEDEDVADEAIGQDQAQLKLAETVQMAGAGAQVAALGGGMGPNGAQLALPAPAVDPAAAPAPEVVSA